MRLLVAVAAAEAGQAAASSACNSKPKYSNDTEAAVGGVPRYKQGGR